MKPSLILCAAVLLSGCTAQETAPPAQSASATDDLTVIAAFYPLEWATQQVLGQHGSVTGLVPPGSEAHDLELSPQQIASLSEADLVIYLEGFQPAVDEAIAQSGARALNAAEVVELIASPQNSTGHDHSHEGHDHHDHGHSHHDHDHSHEATADEHQHGDLDPHFWQDPTRMAKLVERLGTELSEVDTQHASSFSSAASETVTMLKQLDEEFTTQLSSCERTEFITTHTAFSYLASRYGLHEIGISGINPDDEPSPARIAQIQEEAQAHGVNTIFFETLTSDAVASAIANDLGLHTAVLDPLEGVTDASPGTNYPDIMRANLAALVKANGCS